MCSGLFVIGRAIAVMPQASAAIAISSTLSSVSVPCSQSSSTQSKPAAPIISTICGDGIITETPNTGSPARSFSFMRFFFISPSLLKSLSARRPKALAEEPHEIVHRGRRGLELLAEPQCPGAPEERLGGRRHRRLDPQLPQHVRDLRHLVMAPRVRGRVAAHPVRGGLLERVRGKELGDLAPEIVADPRALPRHQELDEQRLHALGEDAA